MRWTALVLVLVGTAVAQPPEPTPTPPIDRKIELRLSLVGKKREFHMGEIVPINLAFSSRVKDRYYLNEAEYDRSGRMNYEQFKVTPVDGVEDPLAEYFRPDRLLMGGGLTNLEFLTAKPWTIQLYLNAWLRFTKPGDYRLRVFSNRVEIVDALSSHMTSPITARSNEIEFRILPRDEAWEKRTYNEAVATLGRAGPDTDAYEGDGSPATEALETLRFLESADATRELVNQLRGKSDGRDFICNMGLLASPQVAIAREALGAALADPNRPLGDGLIDALAWFEEDGAKHNGQDSLQAERVFLEKLVRSLPNKHPDVLRVSLYNVLNRALTHAPPLLPQKVIEELVTQLIPMFDQLPAKEQEASLDYRWNDIKTPAFLPLLKKYAQKNESDLSNVPPADYHNVRRLTTLALRRWYELDPAAARPVIIERIKQLTSSLRDSELKILPDKTLPELDQTFVHRLTADPANDWSMSSLITRYGSATIFPDVVKKTDRSTDECGPPNEILAYILRVDPAAAKPRIEKTIALCAKKNSRCSRHTLRDVAAIHYDSVLQDLAIRHLDDPDPLTAADAANLLGEFGSAAAEAALLRRYENWSKRWNGHAAELNLAALKDTNDGRADQLVLGRSLFEALATGQAWLMDQTKLQRLAKITNIPINRFEFDRYAEVWNEKPLVLGIEWCAAPFNGHFLARLVQYKFNSIDRLKEKIDQFAVGTEFALSVPFDETDRQCVAEIRDFLTSRRMSVVEEKRK